MLPYGQTQFLQEIYINFLFCLRTIIVSVILCLLILCFIETTMLAYIFELYFMHASSQAILVCYSVTKLTVDVKELSGWHQYQLWLSAAFVALFATRRGVTVVRVLPPASSATSTRTRSSRTTWWRRTCCRSGSRTSSTWPPRCGPTRSRSGTPTTAAWAGNRISHADHPDHPPPQPVCVGRCRRQHLDSTAGVVLLGLRAAS